MTKIKKAEIVREEDLKQIKIPERMDIRDAIKWLNRQMEAEESDVVVNEVFDCHPWDGAYQLSQVLDEIYGWVDAVAKKSFFGDTPPAVKRIRCSPTEFLEVPWGNLEIPGVTGVLEVGGMRDRSTGLFKFFINATVWKRHEAEIGEIYRRIHERLANGQSIYNGYPIQLGDDGDIEYLDVQDLLPSDLILEDIVSQAVNANIFTPIRYTNAVRAAGIPLKRGVLLSGPFGVGKSMTANITMNLCRQHGWTYILVKRASDLTKIMHMAKKYTPVVIFVEDIDTLFNDGRTEQVNELLELVDGVLSKNKDIMLVMTTNALEKIHGSFLRPGRLDALIHFTRPDAKAAAALVRKYCGELAGDDFDEKAIGEACQGMIPAGIREVCERAKLHAVTHAPEEDISLETASLVEAAASIRAHMTLVDDQTTDPHQEINQAKAVIRKLFSGIFTEDMGEVQDTLKAIHEAVV